MLTRAQFYRGGATDNSLRIIKVAFGDGLPGELIQRPRNIPYTADSEPVAGSSSTPRFSDPAFSARQYYELTDLKYNGAPVWRGITDPNFWIVRGLAPVSITLTGFTKIVNPVVGGPTAYTNVWKVIERASPDDFDMDPQHRDFYRSSLQGVVDDSGLSVFGVVDGGPHPASGIYLRAGATPILPEQFTISGGVLRLETWDGESETQGQASRQNLCSEICTDCVSIPVWDTVGMTEWLEAAEAACTDRGLVFLDSVMQEPSIDEIDGSTVYRGYTCCR